MFRHNYKGLGLSFLFCRQFELPYNFSWSGSIYINHKRRIMKLQQSAFLNSILTLYLLLGTSTCLLAQHDDAPPPSAGKADTDGPHLFYRKNKIYIRNVKMQDTTAVATLDSIENKRKDELVIECRFTNNPEWNFKTKLKTKWKIENTEYPKVEKLLAVSDIEGNFGSLRRFLVSHKVIDEQYNWIFGKGHLVCVGDFFDRGPNVTECLWLIYDLEEKAKAAGGYVHFILGNHEILNMSNDQRYVHPKYMRNADLYKEPYVYWFKENTELGRWLKTKNVIERIGDLIFVHGGLSPDLNYLDKSLSEINNTMRPFYFIQEDVFRIDDEVLKFFFDANGPLWYRNYVMGQAQDSEIEETLRKFGGKHIIVGHTLVTAVKAFYGGKVIAIDTRHVDPNSTALMIESGKFYRIDQTGKRAELKMQ